MSETTGRTTTRTKKPATGTVVGSTARSTARSTASKAPDASVGQLMGEVAADLSALMRKEVELAKAEIKQEATKAGLGAGMLGGAGYAANLLMLFASLAATFGIGETIGLPWAALIVAGIWAVIALVLATAGRKKLQSLSPTPERTVESLKEDARWARHPRS